MQQKKRKSNLRKFRIVCFFFLTMCLLTFVCHTPILVQATEADMTNTENSTTNTGENEEETYNGITGNIGDVNFNLTTEDGSGTLTATLQMLLVLTIITLAPSILVMVTSFTRIIIVLHFARSALGTQTTPPNQILISLALFLTFFIMAPTFTEINNTALQPLSAGEISQEQAFKNAENSIRNFMFTQMDTDKSGEDLKLFLEISGIEPETREDIPTTTLIPAFILSELRMAFIMGFLLYIPFIVIDMVVASTLMSMGMMMLPPTTISMPFKILLFIMADGWNLIIGQVVKTFY